MERYVSRQALIDEINKRAELFIHEFDNVANEDKDKRKDGVDRTPAQMIAYQFNAFQLADLEMDPYQHDRSLYKFSSKNQKVEEAAWMNSLMAIVT